MNFVEDLKLLEEYRSKINLGSDQRENGVRISVSLMEDALDFLKIAVAFYDFLDRDTYYSLDYEKGDENRLHDFLLRNVDHEELLKAMNDGLEPPPESDPPVPENPYPDGIPF